MNIRLNLAKRRLLFLFGVAAVYAGLMVWQGGLGGPVIWDERTYWHATLFFSNHPVPTLQDLNNYGELSTPLPFIVFGATERWFNLGVPAGRWLNLMLSLAVVFAIGWPRELPRYGRFSEKIVAPTLLCLIGLLVCPYFWFAGIRLYTDMMACFWVLMGYMAYVRNRHGLSSLSFILAIASRQYMLAFPMAIAVYEFAQIISPNLVSRESANLTHSKGAGISVLWPSLAALAAVLSMAGWVYVFGGLTPETAVVHRIQTNNPESWAATQRTLWSVRPGIALNFLAYVGLYMVIPEGLLFWSASRFKELEQRWREVAVVAIGLGLLFWLFPPLVKDHGILAKFVYPLPSGVAQMMSLYGLALLSCLRFSRFDLMTLMVVFNSLIMLKAHPWDKYALPLVVVFWYAKSAGLVDKSSRFFSRESLASRRFRFR